MGRTKTRNASPAEVRTMSTACKILPAQPAPCISFHCLLLSSAVLLWCSWRLETSFDVETVRGL